MTQDAVAPQITETIWQTGDPLSLVGQCVCGPCNNGWMSDMELAAKPLVEPMILGNHINLDAQAQAAVAAWASLKSMVGRYAVAPADPILSHWLAYFSKHRIPPDDWQVWAVRYSVEVPNHFQSQRVSFIRPESPAPRAVTNHHGILTSFIVGYFGFKSLGLRALAASPPPDSIFIKLWPLDSNLISWPPIDPVTDLTLKDFLWWLPDFDLA